MKKNFIVQKFGGTSVGNAQRIRNVARLVQDGQPKVVVLSAVAGTTNALVDIASALFQGDKQSVTQRLSALRGQYATLVDKLFDTETFKVKATDMVEAHWKHIESFTLDMFTRFEERAVLAQGELISTMLMQLHLEEMGTQSVLLPALEFMRVDQQGEPDMWYVRSNLERLLAQHSGSSLFITQGFICRNHFGEIDNLKRGGSDYTAGIIGAALKAAEVQIWTDIDGMHNNDPRVVNHTRPIPRLTFDEAAELAYFGAKILHPSSVLPARKAGVPVILKNTMQPEMPGTIISVEASDDSIKAVAAKDGITSIRIRSDRMLLAYGFLRKVFEVFERHRISIDMITTSEVAVGLTIDQQGDHTELLAELQLYGQVEVERDQCIICVVGRLPQNDHGRAASIFDALREIPLRMISYGGSQNNVSILIHASDKQRALEALNRGLFHIEEE